MRTAIIILIVFILAVPFLTAQDSTPAELVRQLGNPAYEERQKAMDELKKIGFGAREEVRKALSSNDPEVKERARELWKSLRWMLFENSGQNIGQKVSMLGNRDADVEIWGELYKSYGSDIIYIIVEMNNDKKLTASSQRGFAYLLEKSDANEMAAKISGCKTESVKLELVDYIKSVMPENMKSDMCLKMMDVLKQLWLYEDAIIFGKEAWITWKNDKVISSIADAVKLGMMSNELWPRAIQELKDESDKSSREVLAAFYISLAGELGRQDKVKTIVDAIGGKIEDKSTLQRACEILMKNGQDEELLKLTTDRKEAILNYMRLTALSRNGKETEAEGIWKNLLATVNSEEELFSLGEFISVKGRDRRSEQIWWKIIDLGKGKKDSIYVINALLRAAPYQEERGEYGKAADMLERVLKSSKEIGGCFFTSRNSKEDPEKSMRKKVDELREKERSRKSKADDNDATLESTIGE